jgi:hypothetical protein
VLLWIEGAVAVDGFKALEIMVYSANLGAQHEMAAAIVAFRWRIVAAV